MSTRLAATDRELAHKPSQRRTRPNAVFHERLLSSKPLHLTKLRFALRSNALKRGTPYRL